MREVNFLASSVVLDAAIEHGATRFLFASTDSVYGIQSGVMYETGTPEPSSLYSRLKLRMEERVINSRSREFHPTALRIATCYGISPRMRFDLIVNALVRDAVCKKRLEIASGEQCRALVHVEDAARAFVSCLKAHVNLVSGEVFNLGSNDQKIQLHQLANLVATLVPDTEVRVGGADPDLFDYHLSASKIQKILDFNPKWGIPQAITELRDRLREGVFGDPYDPKYRNT
jgi:nucleoside-diphosphate-sugar epimerase